MCSTRDHSGVEGLKATIFCRNGALYPAIYVTTAFTLGCELLKPAALHPGITPPWYYPVPCSSVICGR